MTSPETVEKEKPTHRTTTLPVGEERTKTDAASQSAVMKSRTPARRPQGHTKKDSQGKNAFVSAVVLSVVLREKRKLSGRFSKKLEGLAAPITLVY